MLEKSTVFGLFLIFTLTVFGFAQEQDMIVIEGTIEEIAEDGSYIIIDETKIITDKDLLESSYVSEGDDVIISAEKTSLGLKANSIDFSYEEEYELEEASSEEQTTEDYRVEDVESLDY